MNKLLFYIENIGKLIIKYCRGTIIFRSLSLQPFPKYPLMELG